VSRLSHVHGLDGEKAWEIYAVDIDMYRVFFEIQKRHWWFVVKKKIVLDSISRHFDKSFSAKVLDIGCGSGLMLDALQEIGRTSGMDMSDIAIKFSVEIFDGDVRKGCLPDQIPYSENSFDLITALDVIEHVDQDIESLKAIRSRLVSGGKAVITVPAYMFMWSSFDELNEHKRRYTLKELRAKLVQAGFTIERISYFNTLLFPFVLAIRVVNNLTGRDGSSDIKMPNRPLNYALTVIFGLEKYLLRFLNLPYGVSVLAVVRK
jgi:2-polyprenyl-3-methyl-5-hydroxy-6-metoxy-1,4-benzoquinol methylase